MNRTNESLSGIKAQDLSKHIQTISSDAFEGRAPATKGEEKTIRYIKKEFESTGLLPGNGDSYFQEVPMVSVTTDPDITLTVRIDDKGRSFLYGNECMVSTKRLSDTVSIENSDMVFVGYGIVAPEYDWNDYSGVDVRGKTVVMLVNDPGFATQNPALFNGNAMTYYGRWTYKFEEAARQGAEAAVIIHETKPAGYPWDVVRSSWSGPQFDLITKDDNMSRCAVEGWFTLESAHTIFDLAGKNLEQLKASAAKRGFKPVPLNARISVTLNNTIEHSRSNNVIGVLPGAVRRDEYVFYMAHWDHLGTDPSLEGDQIYNGALDNATGVAGLIELAEAFARLPEPLDRSIAFLAVTGEEQGLLGSAYYAAHPIYPPAKTVAAINMDGLNIYGRMKDVTVIGYGNSELDGYVESAASEQGRIVRPDPEPEKGHFYRADHFSFARQGIPSLYVTVGMDHVEHGEEWTKAQIQKYTENHYHKPSDKFDPEWDLSGMVEDLQLLFRVGCRLCTGDAFPNWQTGTEFRSKRNEDMKLADPQ
ncbi:MAG: M28 family metallopeptidase [Acidobacteriota bacterium]